ncbi:MAG: T9SS type A sorting domain-containing protein [Ignavibacteria bacterium]|nr:T9SS type A sorting domain-containing protein [Ignavibacteria bacterium]
MSNRYSIKALALIILFLAVCTTGQAQRKAPSANDILSVNGAQGTEFWIAIPPNEINPFPISKLEIYIASAFDTEVTVYEPAGNTSFKRKITANQIRTLSDGKGETKWTWECRTSEQVVPQGIRLTADVPISVYVLNSKITSSDGYLAIPTSSWGNEYICTSYWDFREYKPWAGGFIIIAKDNGTILDITLRGQGENYGKTVNGKKINTGQTYQISMEAGDVYKVQGDGQSRGVFDLTGSKVRSNNPIGMISYHERTTMPNLLINGNGRDHLCEMTPPVSTWGKRYVTVEYTRDHVNGQGRGDVFRVIAAEAGTKWTVKYYDHKTKATIGQSGGQFGKAGEFADLYQSQGPSFIISGYSVFEADKPIFVMQYSCSSSWDGDINLDPFMINVVPEEQFITTTLFQTPTDTKFTKHYLNLIVKADTADPDYINNLKSLVIDDIAVWNHPQAASPLLLFTNMPQSNLHWTTLSFGTDARAHRIKSNGKVSFGGYIYGFGAVDSYGWPAASGFRPTSFFDTMPPVLKADSVCGNYNYSATEFRNIPDPPLAVPKDSDQVETGVARIDTVDGSNSYNYRLVLLTDKVFPRNPAYKKFDFRWDVIDKSVDAFAIFFVQDYADNVTFDTVSYFADRISFSPKPLQFGKLRLGSKSTFKASVTNSSTGDVVLNLASLNVGTYFKILAGTIPPVVTLGPGKTHEFTIEYDGRRETTDLLTDFDEDTLVVNTACGIFRLGMSGIAAIPRIIVEDFNAGTVGAGIEKCKAGGLLITNPGSDDLIITAITGWQGRNFTVSNPTTPPLPITIAPKQSVNVTQICYKRADVGQDSIDVVFTSNADTDPKSTSDSISTWRGETDAPGPGVTGYDWLKRRVGTLHQSFGSVINTGNQVATLTGAVFMDGTSYFPPGSNEANYVFKIVGIYDQGNPTTNVDLANGKMVDVMVMFRPDAPQVFQATFKPVWSTPGIAEKTATLDGVGIIPTFAVTGALLTCLDTPEGAPARMNLVITNAGNENLTISRLTFAAVTDPAFQWVTAPTVPISIPFAAGSNVVTFPIEFTRPVGNGNGFVLNVEIDHDALPGNGIDSSVTTVLTAAQRFTVGSCTGPAIEVTDVSFAPTLANCETPIAEFTIKNIGGGLKPMEIRNIQPSGADAATFTIVNIIGPAGTSITLPFTLNAQEVARVQVEFSPTEPNAAPWAVRNYTAEFQIRNYVEGDNVELTANVLVKATGSAYVVPVTMNLTNNVSGTPQTPGAEVTFSVAATSANWPKASLTNFIADVIYDTRSHSYVANSVNSSVAGWTVSDPVITAIDATRSQMRFTLTGSAPITGDGNAFTFRTIVLLSPSFKADQTLAVNLVRPCLVPTTTGTNTEIFSCALSKRVVEVGSTQFAFHPVSPNPVQGGSGKIDFAVGLSAPTTIDIVNTQGVVVRSLINEKLSSGAYTLDFQTMGLANGVYVVRMKCADYSATQQLVVAE